VLADEMQRRVLRMRLEKQVTVVDKRVDPNQVLANVHASVCLATDPAIIKSYPHSLMESLAAGKPVIVSRAIPMSDYVDQTGCGRIVERVTASDTLDAIESLSAAYGDLRLSAKHAGRRDFSQEKMIDSFEQVYEQVLDRPSAL
jgi:glycosyltransferase involved in cell wall biosynthesis